MSSMTYLWKGKSAKGETLTGEYDATDKAEVSEYLRKRRIVITSIKKKPKDIQIKFLQKQGVSVKDLSVFTRQFATMVNAGLPLVQCLDVLGRQLDKPHFKTVVLKVTADVEGGSTLAEALEKHPKISSDLYVNMIAAGEAGGASPASAQLGDRLFQPRPAGARGRRSSERSPPGQRRKTLPDTALEESIESRPGPCTL